ncbi:MAG: hypothetical protein MJD61_20425, partial [Proteobacteria bacterium]|nr:hypothetical protein [Pseudomonadota bacterium]
FDAMAKRGLDVADVLVWHSTGGDMQPGRFRTWEEWDLLNNQDITQNGRIIHYDLEVSGWLSSQMGHITALGLNDLTSMGPCPGSANCPPQLDFASGLDITRWAEEHGAEVIGVNHTSNWSLNQSWHGIGLTPLELPIQLGIANAKISFMAVETPGRGLGEVTMPLSRAAWQLWSDLQNSGFRIAIVGGSDNRCFQRQIGQLRTGVLVDTGPLTFAKYLDGIRWGRTQAVYDQDTKANLDAWVGSSPNDVKHIGDTLDVGPQHQGQVLYFRAWTQLVESGLIEVLVNGEVKPNCQWNGNAGQPQYHQCQFTIGPNPGQWHRGAWVSLRAPRVQTSPIYVTWLNQHIYPSFEAPCRLRKHIQAVIDNLALNPGDPLYQYKTKYQGAQGEYTESAINATYQDDDPFNDGYNYCVGSYPDPPPPPSGSALSHRRGSVLGALARFPSR